MPQSILILEDNDDRRAAMRAWLGERLPQYDLRITEDPDEFTGWLRERPGKVLAASLDHDLYERPDGSTEITGMNVVDYLVTVSPSFPVLLHTTNRPDGETMQTRLRDAGWSVDWVVPFDGTNWIATDWYHALKRAIRRTARPAKVPAAESR